MRYTSDGDSRCGGGVDKRGLGSMIGRERRAALERDSPHPPPFSPFEGGGEMTWEKVESGDNRECD